MANKGVNKVILIGNLGQDPEVRHMTNGGIITNITVATSEIWRDKQSGELKEKIEWHRVVLFGKLAEIAGEYLRKGSQVYIEGSAHTRKWQDQNGHDNYITEIIVNINGTMQMLGNRQSNKNSTDIKSINSSQKKQSRFENKNNLSFNNKIKNQNNNFDKDDLIDIDDEMPF